MCPRVRHAPHPRRNKARKVGTFRAFVEAIALGPIATHLPLRPPPRAMRPPPPRCCAKLARPRWLLMPRFERMWLRFTEERCATRFCEALARFTCLFDARSCETFWFALRWLSTLACRSRLLLRSL